MRCAYQAWATSKVIREIMLFIERGSFQRDPRDISSAPCRQGRGEWLGRMQSLPNATRVVEIEHTGFKSSVAMCPAQQWEGFERLDVSCHASSKTCTMM